MVALSIKACEAVHRLPYASLTPILGLQAKGTAASKLLMSFHASLSLKMARSLFDTADAGASVAAWQFNTAIFVQQVAARHAVEILDADSASTAVSSADRDIAAARDYLDRAQRALQQQAAAAVTLPAIKHAEQRSLCMPLHITLPVLPTLDRPQASSAAVEDNLSPLPAPPASNSASAEVVLTWCREALVCGGSNADEVVCAELERWLFRFPLAAFKSKPQTKEQLSGTAELVTYYRKHVNRLLSLLQTEKRSRGALAVWILLCLAHQAAAAEWPKLLGYALPVEPDELRFLVLSCPDAVGACEQVAAYVNQHCRKGRPVFSVKPGDATFELAEKRVADSSKLREHLRDERNAAEQREAALYAAVQKKKDRLAVLDRQLADAQRDMEAKLAAEQAAVPPIAKALAEATERANHCKQALAVAEKAALDATNAVRAQTPEMRTVNRGSNRYPNRVSEPTGKYLEPLLRLPDSDRNALPQQAASRQADSTRDKIQGDHNHAVSLSGSKDDRESGRSMSSSEGQRWSQARASYVASYKRVQAIKADIMETEKPPTDLMHSSPRQSANWRSACVVAFFLRPEYTGCFPILMQACFEAAQVLLPPSSSEVAWDCSPITSPTPQHVQLWHSYFNSHHSAAEYVPRSDLCVNAPEATQASWALLATSQKPSEQAKRPASNNVRDYRKFDEHGIWYPTLDQQLLWQGGRLPRRDLAGNSPSNPFAACGPQRNAAAAFSLTEPSSLRKEGLLCVPTLAKSLLSGSTQMLRDVEDHDHERRGNRVFAELKLHPKRFTMQQWQALAALRAYPQTQIPQLAAALYDRVFDGAWHDEEVRIVVVHALVALTYFSCLCLMHG